MNTSVGKRIILGFWALWIGIIATTNLFSLLKALRLVGRDFRLASHNFDLVRGYLATYPSLAGLATIAFAGVVVWQFRTAYLFFRAQACIGDRKATNAAIGAGMALFAAFLVAGEFFLRFDFEAIHIRIFMAMMISWLVIHLLPDD
ncbi:MAG: hypothetical protein K0R39_3726 [Symbiobacteriaceae bacterium]|jgi:hypothetical protein|nr:hypothetical protein [Symbiobacteriaceae bacterium]